MRAIRGLLVCAVAGWLGFAADVTEGALAKKLGGSGLSGQLSSNRAIRRQQLIADPDEPTSGQESVTYDTSIVTISGFILGPGYQTGTANVEVRTAQGEVVLQDLNSFLLRPLGKETGYAQVTFDEQAVVIGIAASPVQVRAIHGQLNPPTGYITVDKGGPTAVDTHALFFDYLASAADTAVASYTLYADKGGRASGSSADFLTGSDASGSYTINAADIAPITVRGSLVAVPIPPAAYVGGLTLVGAFVITRLKKKSVA